MATDETGPTGPSPSDVKPITIEEEMKRSYLDYAMSVIVSRALPDVRDGLKPVHRRILYAMHVQGFDWSKPYRKSARVVGDVIGKFHPHGDSAVYDALVRMAQDFSMRLPLIDGQGNFGSVDGDPPAAMRYTEARLAKAAGSLLADIDKNTVDFQPNYDASEEEPTVLPARYPNILVNGAGGIAVGMATNIPPHNLGEIIDATIAYIEDPEISPEALLGIVPGPDFPTGGIIIGRSGSRSGLLTGRGSVVVRGRASIEEIRKDREAIIITEIPYQVNKATMVEKIADLVREKKIEGISDIRDESDRQGMRVVVELKRDAQGEVVLNQLYRFTQLQTTFGVNMLALDGGRPELMSLKEMLAAFVWFREQVITRRTKFDLGKARDRAHVLVGLAIAVANVDEVIRLIRESPDPATARARLIERDWPAHDMAPYIKLIADPRSQLSEAGTLRLSEEQARAILDLRLQRLTALGREEIGDELKKLRAEIEDYLDILRSRPRLLGIVREELAAVRSEFATPRRTEIVEAEADMLDEDLIQSEDMVVTVTHGGYIKRVPLSIYRPQRRGGKGRAGMAMKEEDFVARLFVANTHTPVLFFSSIGMVYKLKVWRLPEGSPQARGKAMVNLLPLAEGERITTVMPLPEDEDQWASLNIMFATLSGNVRRNELSDFTNVMANGKIAMKLDAADDAIVDVQICTDADDVLLTTRAGKSIRFRVSDVRVFKGRESTGVRGIRLAEGDELVGMTIIRHVEATPAEARAYLRHAALLRRASAEEGTEHAEEPVAEAGEEAEEATLSPQRFAELGGQEQFLLTVTEKGFGKRTSAFHYRTMGRGGQGVIAMDVGARTGGVVASFPVEEGDQIMLVTDGGQLIRCPVAEISLQSRGTRGVTIFRTAEDEKVVSVEHVPDVAEEDEPEAGA
ncbi:MAG: DNA gyrase subunit A [Alphaproteobacteria bacterium]|nr:DNA gyrase subunit A [Alphaproteobacteria bacterium]